MYEHDEDEKVRAAQSIILTWYGVIVDLHGVDEEILDFVNDNVSEGDVGADNQTFAAWCDQVFGFDEFGVRVRPPVAQFLCDSAGQLLPPAGQTHISRIRDGAELSRTFREWSEGNRLEVESLRLEAKKLKSKIRRLEKSVDVNEGQRTEENKVVKEGGVLKDGCYLINDLHILRDEYSESWVPGLRCDLVELLNELDEAGSVDSVLMLSNFMGRINKRIKSAEWRSGRNKEFVDFGGKGMELNDGAKAPESNIPPSVQKKSSEFTPSLKIPKKPVLFLAIDMWGMEGKYSDGGWHEPVRKFILGWAKKYPEQKPATVWSSIQSHSMFESFQACYMAASISLSAQFLRSLERHLSSITGGRCRIDGEILVRNGEWRPYLHIENGEAWEQVDAVEWRAISK
jgi:hypothetical protein